LFVVAPAVGVAGGAKTHSIPIANALQYTDDVSESFCIVSKMQMLTL
jgi:hypothetical protein